jgi:hypothetical protein
LSCAGCRHRGALVRQVGRGACWRGGEPLAGARFIMFGSQSFQIATGFDSFRMESRFSPLSGPCQQPFPIGLPRSPDCAERSEDTRTIVRHKHAEL